MNLKRILVAAATAATLFICLAGAAEARRRGGGGFGGQPFSRSVGLGLVIYEPTGLSAELRLSNRTSLDFALGLDSFDEDGFYLHVDYLVYLVDLARGGSVGVPLYLGFGGVVLEHGNELDLGVRVPFGLAIALRTAPVQFFMEVAVRVFIADTHDGSHDRTNIDGGIGFRVYF